MRCQAQTSTPKGAGLPEQFGSMSAQAVYDMLAACTTAGPVRRIEPTGYQR